MIEKHTDKEAQEVEFVILKVLGTLERELRVKRGNRWHYVLLVIPEFDEGDAIYKIGSNFNDGTLKVILKSVARIVSDEKFRRNWERRP